MLTHFHARYDDANAHDEGEWFDASWYTRQDGEAAGLLDDFTFRHTPSDYARPNAPVVERLRYLFWIVPLAAPLACLAVDAWTL